ncbi:phosphatase PAP2 family protein [Parahaliea mediterranea]|uniref:phosphatase PAP2 family protein n=1 Tax=Parahaliea mediterranea TaxID=651086 RepID=UPI0019D4BED9|nr:phosphatase PAP2 family protein [Parahaliea mediterranea]
MNALQELDLRLLARVFRQGERRMVRPLARALSRSGDGYLHLLIPLLLALIGARYLDQFCTLLALSLAAERTLYWSLKNTLKRRRPQEAVPGFRSLITASDQFSFPSGHSSAAFLLATVLVLVYGGPVIAMYLWATSVALSRIVLGVHFPGDTVAGALMGTACALFTAALLGLPG